VIKIIKCKVLIKTEKEKGKEIIIIIIIIIIYFYFHFHCSDTLCYLFFYLLFILEVCVIGKIKIKGIGWCIASRGVRQVELGEQNT